MSQQSSPSFSPALLAPWYWPTWVGVGFLKLLAVLPLPVSMTVGRGIGWLFYHLARPRRRVTQINIDLCFPDLSPRERRELVRGVMRELGIGVTETALAFWGSERKLRGLDRVHGKEHLDDALARGKGVLLVGAHYSTLDICGRFLARHVDYDLLYRRGPNPVLAWVIAHSRQQFSGEVIHRNDTRQMVRRLRQGRVVWYAPDQDYGASHSVFAPFFGVETATITGTARLARMGNATVMTTSHYRDAQGYYHIEFHPPFVDYPSGDDRADAARINSAIEQAVRRYPTQYWWVHRRFKTRPPGEPPVYPPRRRRAKAR